MGNVRVLARGQAGRVSPMVPPGFPNPVFSTLRRMEMAPRGDGKGQVGTPTRRSKSTAPPKKSAQAHRPPIAPARAFRRRAA